MQAVHEGKKINIVEFALGDGNGEYQKPTKEATALENEVWRGVIILVLVLLLYGKLKKLAW